MTSSEHKDPVWKSQMQIMITTTLSPTPPMAIELGSHAAELDNSMRKLHTSTIKPDAA
jgi:hypothetical protein